MKFVSDNPVFALATSFHNQPFVRMIMLYDASQENGILFSTWQQKDLYEQLKFNPRVELCFYSHTQGKQVRIKGRIEILEDVYIKKQMGLKFKFLRPQIEKYGFESLMVCRLKRGKATAWSLTTAFEEKKYFDF
ncbi:MAG: pyridoxamine 5'-phosphate oxidase family protein [Calditrichaceae bacterium]